jgi:SAM-dependent methyltransferase
MPSRSAYELRSASTRLYARLDEEDTVEIKRRVAQCPDLYVPPAERSDSTVQLPILLSYGMWLGVSSVAEKTKLPSVQPPETVHAMARGPLAAAGGLYEADLVADAVRSAGVDIATIDRGLDFGCSSGRLVRVLAAAYPRARWLACDPNEPAIRWASENLHSIDFFVNANEPPLQIDDASLDLVCAISIWSHFSPALGLRWFAEMHRLIRPGGHLVCTTHGLTSIAFFAENGMRTSQQASDMARALYRRGWWYANEFGVQGDWGLIHDDWGTAFLSPEWLLSVLCPQWRVAEFAPGQNQGNQDVYVLERAARDEPRAPVSSASRP